MANDDHQARKRLLELDDTDIVLIAEMPGVGQSWARRANIKHSELTKGGQRAFVRLKAALARDARDFALDLAMVWDRDVKTQLANADPADPTLFGVRVAATIIGSTGARALIACLAASETEVSAEIAERFDELSAAADQPLSDGEIAALLPEELTTSLSEQNSPVEPPEPESDNSIVGSQADESEPAAPNIQMALQETRLLREQGLQLAVQLRQLSEAAEQGRPTESAGTVEASQWFQAVREQLDLMNQVVAADSLPTLEEGLTAILDARAARLENARNALETIEYLRGRGLHGVIPSTLSELGFASIEEAEQIVGTSTVSSPQAEALEQVPELPADDISSTRAQPVADESVGQEPEGPVATVEPDAPIEIVSPPNTDVLTDSPPRTEIEDTPLSEPDQADTSLHHTTSAERSVEAVDSGQLPEFPWDEPTPPLIAHLLLEERYELACHVAAATDDTPRHQSLLRLTCAAARCSRDALELSLPQLIPDDSDIEQFNTAEIRVLLAAALRAGLRLGYAPLGLSALIDRADLDDAALATAIQVLAAAVQCGRTREHDQSSATGEQLAGRWSDLSQEASELPAKLNARKLIYQRSSKVLHHLARAKQPLGQVLRLAGELTARGIDGASSDDWAQLDEFAEDLLNHGKRERLINGADREVSSTTHRRNPIIAVARAQLHEQLAEVGEFLNRLRTVRRAILNADDIKSVEVAQDVDRALAQAPVDTLAPRVGIAALLSLIRWRRDGERVPAEGSSVEELLDLELLSIFEIPRDVHGRPTRQPTGTEVAELLLVPRDHHVVVAGHLANGNIAAARTYIAEEELEGEFDDDILRAASDAEQRCEIALLDAQLGAARLRALYHDDEARDLAAEIDALRAVPHDRWDLAIAAFEAITRRANDAIGLVHDDLRARTSQLRAGGDAKARILDRLENGDEALALEFLTMLESGQRLPDVEDHHGDDFADFYPAVVNAAADAQSNGKDAVAAVRAVLSATQPPSSRQLRDGLDGWRTIKRAQRSDANAFRLGVAQVLRMVGLVPRSSDWMKEISRIQRAGYATYRVKASPVDRSYVPELGTQANGSYDVTFVWDNVSPARMLDFIDERTRATQPNIVFYFGVLDANARVQLRNFTLPGRGKGFSPLVVDEAVIGWLSSRQEPGWRFTQRVALPFTTINPYTPFAGGEVPEEVFVGRDDERRRIESPTGPMFVYGGRQLGKSALLRSVERKFNESSPPWSDQAPRAGNVAVYIDLKAAGVGEAKEPAALWPLLGERLQRAGVIPAKGIRTGTEQIISTHIKNWLDAEPENRLLVLLDEADNFLTVDANADGATIRGSFPVLQSLKGIMESSQRRFKPVFAGLHQVQRFHDTSNTPVAHGGADILIGPLKSSDAYSLVVDPMSALGYRFANAELVWRLLLVTNYQASLVQIVCEALASHMQTRSISADGGRIIIEERDVRAVCEDEEVQHLIAQRFRWTINLDSRYRLIALVLALRSRNVNQPAMAFPIDDLRDDCETFWPQGFSRSLLSRNQFERYLDEMVGLGVLYRRGDQFGLRSPNIVRMLGSEEALEQELEDAGSHLEPALEYNPTNARQIIDESAGFWSPRSPLTDHELTQILSGEATHPVRIIFGSAALAIDRAAEAIKREAKSKGIECILSTGSAIPGLAERHHFGKLTHVVVDITGDSVGADLAELADRLSGRANLSATIVADAPLYSAVERLDVPVVPLHRWSLDGLRAWHDSPFDDPALRRQLFRVTSGWPKVVEHAMQLVKDGRSTEDALNELLRTLGTPAEAARMLADSAIDRAVAGTWATWFSRISPEDGLTESETVSMVDLGEVLGTEPEPVLSALEALDLVTTEQDGWVLDRVVIAAAALSAN